MRNWLVAIVLLVTAFTTQSTPALGQSASKTSDEGPIVLDRVEPGITPPHATYSPDPEYDDADRRAKVSGAVVLSIVVTKEGRTKDPKVVKSLSPGLDKKAVEAVSKWKFTPAIRDGNPIAVQIKIEVTFRIR